MIDVREFIQQDKIDKGYPLEGIVYRAQFTSVPTFETRLTVSY